MWNPSTDLERQVSDRANQVITKIASHIELSFESIVPLFTLPNWLILVTAHAAAYAFETSAFDQNSSLFPRLLICLLGLPLFVAPLRRKMEPNDLRLGFVCFSILLLPGLFGYLALWNSSHPSHGYWLAQFFIASFLFFAFFQNQRVPLVISLLTIGVIFAGRYVANLPDLDQALVTLLWLVAAVLTVYWFGLITHQRLSFVSQQKLRAARAVGGKVAHELRTPLFTIKTLAIGISNPKKDSSRTPEDLAAMIVKEVEHANMTIDMLLMTTKPVRGEFGFSESCESSTTIRNSIEKFPYRNSIERNSVSEGTTHSFCIQCRSDFLSHILFNLIGNALDFADDYRDFQVNIFTRETPKNNEIVVSDTGPTIPDEVQKKMFEEFFTTKGIDGTGIGLAFCQSAASTFGGDLIYSQSNGVKEFIIRIKKSTNDEKIGFH